MDVLNIIMWVTAVVTIASVVATMTPTKSDDKFVALILKGVRMLALNFGSAKPKD